MTDEEFTRKLQQVLVAMSEIWDEPQWDFLGERLFEQGEVDLDSAQVAFTSAERLINPNGELLTLRERVEIWKQQTNKTQA